MQSNWRVRTSIHDAYDSVANFRWRNATVRHDVVLFLELMWLLIFDVLMPLAPKWSEIICHFSSLSWSGDGCSGCGRRRRDGGVQRVFWSRLFSLLTMRLYYRLPLCDLLGMFIFTAAATNRRFWYSSSSCVVSSRNVIGAIAGRKHFRCFIWFAWLSP